jgi:hypothetical protein
MALSLIDPSAPIVVKDSELDGIVGGDPEVTYTLKPIAVEDHRKLQKTYTKQAIDRRTHQKVDEVDFEGLADATLDFILVDWSGILIQGQPAPCVKANKLKLDGPRRVALTGMAGMNQIARSPEVRAESFSESA